MRQVEVEFKAESYEIKASEDISDKVDMEFLFRYENGDCIELFSHGSVFSFKEPQLKAYPIIKRTEQGAWILTNAESAYYLFRARGTVENRVMAIENRIRIALYEVKDLKTSPLYGKKFVLLSARKQYASETKKEALRQFIERRNSQVQILTGQLRTAEAQLRFAREMWEKEGE